MLSFAGISPQRKWTPSSQHIKMPKHYAIVTAICKSNLHNTDGIGVAKRSKNQNSKYKEKKS